MRGFSAAYLTAASASSGYAELFLCELDFISGMLRLTTASSNVSYGGQLYYGVGDLGQIGPWTEGLDGEIRGYELTLSGLPSQYLALAMSDDAQGRVAKIMHCFVDAAGTIIASGAWAASTIDTMSIDFGGAEASITVRVEDPTVTLQVPKLSYYSDEDLQRRYPGDRFFDLMQSIQDEHITF